MGKKKKERCYRPDQGKGGVIRARRFGLLESRWGVGTGESIACGVNCSPSVGGAVVPACQSASTTKGVG